jgi:hypothetical protein
VVVVGIKSTRYHVEIPTVDESGSKGETMQGTSGDKEPIEHEKFDEFKNSFSYGSRTDLNFKFLKGLSNEASATFFQELLRKLGDTIDDGDPLRLIKHVYEWQIMGYDKVGRWAYEDGPFTPFEIPLSESKVGLISSSGHFIEGQDPEPFGEKNMTQDEAVNRIIDFIKAEPTLTEIPFETPEENLRVRQGGYDIRGAGADPNVVFPISRMKEFREEGMIGELAELAYSFVGAASQRKILDHAGHQWVNSLLNQKIDACILVPV